jgi:hypothetical protein
MLYLVVEKENNYYYNPSGRLPLPPLLFWEAPPPDTISSLYCFFIISNEGATYEENSYLC